MGRASRRSRPSLANSLIVPDRPLSGRISFGDAFHKAVPPDFKLEGDHDDVGFIRRKLPAEDIYFVANTSNHPVALRATFATTHKFGQRWDADTGTAVSGQAYTSPAAIPMILAAYESAIFVFSDSLCRQPRRPERSPRSPISPRTGRSPSPRPTNPSRNLC